jgi:porphobilinogen deaminase
MRVGIIQDEINAEKLHDYKMQLELIFNNSIVIEEVFDNEALLQLLQKDQIQCTIQLMENLPLDLPSGICIAALIDRFENNYVLQVSPSDFDENMDLRLIKNTYLNLIDPLIQKQISRLRADISIDENASSSISRSDEISAKKNYNYIKLHFSEVVPPVSSGLVCILTHEDDYATRRLLKKIHNTDLVQASNVERTFKQLRPNSNVYCYLDNRKNYQLHYAYLNENEDLIFGRESSTTYLQLAEFALKGL